MVDTRHPTDVDEHGISALGRRLGETRLGVWLIKHLISPTHRRIYRLSGGRLFSKGKSLGPVLLLTTTGRRTGKERTTPLFYLRDDERLIVCNVNPGFERPNPWTLNTRIARLPRTPLVRSSENFPSTHSGE